MLNGITVVLAFVIAGVAAFSFVVYNYYYSALQTGLESKAAASSGFFTTYVTHTYAEYYQSAYRYTESFDDRDKLELQFVNTNGRVEISSYGITAGTSPNTPDIEQAVQTGEISIWSGKRSDTGERVMAVSSPLLYSDSSVIGVMRYVTSLDRVDAQIFRIISIAAGVGLLILVIVILSNLYFIRTIIEPIRELTAISHKIAEGSYGIQAEKKFDDEIGELTDTINEMSFKIGQAERVQTEFISSVSHELRTPLTAITGWSETLTYDTNIKGDSRRGVTIISQEAARLTKMVEDLLEFTRAQDGGSFKLSFERMDVAAQLEDSLLIYGELLRNENIEMIYKPYKGKLPNINGDPSRLRQVFLNILDNAAKYGRAGGKIIVTTNLFENHVVIKFRDFGPGIPPAELQHVKEKFYKGSSKERGSGIGLAVCDEIIGRHNGILNIENAQGGGVLVTIMLHVGLQQP